MLLPIQHMHAQREQMLLSCSKHYWIYVNKEKQTLLSNADIGLSPVQRAIRRLQLDCVPDTLPCRTAEFQKIRQTILTSIKQENGGELLSEPRISIRKT
ncbi:hypothetical protein EMWEY_00015100 [Eimeria maxima]|uniref:Uncharacterized protein n=1 Tax=Eimeria maxima TaxID=5804 RepID=U6LZ63_EIMMA|nr:hypothetical protein EMWEY_00015100 [Eimeria maxima]CDJ56138.1 hypothetical protein EMWEY_00015100 [Eimeria maxima]